jgi:hypothetical protein
VDVDAVSVKVAELGISAQCECNGGEVSFLLVDKTVVVALNLRAPVDAMVEVIW